MKTHQLTLAFSQDASKKGNGGYLALGDPTSLLANADIGADTSITATVSLEYNDGLQFHTSILSQLTKLCTLAPRL